MISLRVATYNIHKAQGMDRRVDPGRIADVLAQTRADIIALQEVLSVEGGPPREDQASYIAERLGMEHHVGKVRRLRGGVYGNVTLSRYPIRRTSACDITWRHCERRGCLRADVDVGGRVLHLFNVHLGTAFFERRFQARRLISEDLLRDPSLSGPRIVLGDFNEWTRGLVTRMLSEEMESVDLQLHFKRRRTYPGLFPVLHLDHVYFDPELELESFTVHRSRLALVASDHLPLVAGFRWGTKQKEA